MSLSDRCAVADSESPLGSAELEKISGVAVPLEVGVMAFHVAAASCRGRSPPPLIGSKSCGSCRCHRCHVAPTKLALGSPRNLRMSVLILFRQLACFRQCAFMNTWMSRVIHDAADEIETLLV